MERRDLFQDDLTEERMPTPGEREDVAHSLRLDPDILPADERNEDAELADERDD